MYFLFENSHFPTSHVTFTKNYACSQGHGPHPPQGVRRVSWCEVKQLEAVGLKRRIAAKGFCCHMFFAAVGIAIGLNFGVEACIFMYFSALSPVCFPCNFHSRSGLFCECTTPMRKLSRWALPVHDLKIVCSRLDASMYNEDARKCCLVIQINNTALTQSFW